MRAKPSTPLGTLWLLAAVLFLASFHSSAVMNPPKINVVIILADDLGWGDLGCYGSTAFKTPHIDRMAREGARLTHFYSPAPYCAPSRAALLTGRYQFRSGMTRNPTPDDTEVLNHIGLPENEITLAEAFKSAGYKTGMIGKWHLGHKPEFYPTRHGFDEYFGILYSHDMRPVQLIERELVIEYPVVAATLTRRYTERALDFLQVNRRKPFLLYIAHAMPHKPLAASEHFYKKSGAGLYGDVVAELDWSVGKVLAKLKELGIEERTLVIFTSDNGPWYGGSTGGLRGMKGTTWEGGIRVPLVARWPGKIPAGHVSREPAILMDVFSTALKAAGIAAPADRVIDGRDMLPILTSHAKSSHEALFSMSNDALRTVRSGQWKLHVQPPGNVRVAQPGAKWVDRRAPDGVTILAPYEQSHPSQFPGVLTGDEANAMSLFDLAADPAEQHDVSAQHPEIVQRLEKLHAQLNREIAVANKTQRPVRPPRR
jgi:arylsulfatase A-like enzyme